jgi:fumarate reductase flavoprotein subunit
MTTIRQEDFIQSVADAFQFISYYHPKDYIDHPDTPGRQAEVDALKAKLSGADRFAVQQALMPYEQWLPQVLRGRNERIDERFPRAA